MLSFLFWKIILIYRFVKAELFTAIIQNIVIRNIKASDVHDVSCASLDAAPLCSPQPAQLYSVALGLS